MARNDGLRDYQQEMKLRLFEEWELHRSVMVQMPTGTGKTHLLAAVVKEFLCGGGVGMRVWIVAHRRELVEQIEETVARYGMGKEPDKSAKNGRTGKDSMPEESGRVRVFSIQWLSRNRKIMDGQPDLIVIDEAHHALAETYRELWKRYPEARKLGMTATPCRLNRKGFTDLFDTLITSWSIAEFIGRGWLSSFDYVSIRANSREQRLVDSLKKRGADGDYQVKEMNAVLNRETGIRQLYESVRRYAAGKKGIVYAVSIAHARQIAAYYSLHGVESVAIDSRTPALERKELVEDFRRGRIKILVNVDIFSEGFDCPDVEFVQLARPTLSLAKYLQQVGRGLRKSDDKDSCVLIDNVGLHRIFGLPVRDRDWEAMFEGRMSGNAQPRIRMENNGLSVSVPQPEDGRRNEELEVVMTHARLLDAVRNGDLVRLGEDGPAGGEQRTALKACRDRQSGLWGLRCGNKITVLPQYREVFDLCADRAAVRFEDGRAGVVDDSGTPLVVTDRCRRLRFLKGELLAVTREDGSDCYTDLRTNRAYRERPVVFSYGGIELLRVGESFHSRTRKAYVSMHGLHKDSLCFHGFYLKIPDYRVPKSCRLVDPVWTTLFDVFACVLSGDDEEVYWCCGRLADRSIVVMDGDGNYYHVEKGRGKRYIACNAPKAGEADFASVMEDLMEEAGRRAESVQRERQQDEEEKRRKRLDEIKDVLPFRMGLKWGLKWGDRIVVPPCYRNICVPVGGYCAFEGNACQWGVMALDGKVVVEARYQKVEIEKDGTVHLTIIPGKVKTINL
ncbi:DEAD/DEAH box helicase [Phocaeicola sartorii]|uniref:DEAD/DEAH box helicase n=1 Tax=Phocaeicola sartorii TaxID=671267 RepID=UPI003F68CB58